MRSRLRPLHDTLIRPAVLVELAAVASVLYLASLNAAFGI